MLLFHQLLAIPAPEEHVATIFIHGTVLPILHLPTLRKVLNDRDGAYNSYLEALRYETHYQEQAIGPLGLTCINIESPYASTPNYSQACHRIITQYDRSSRQASKQTGEKQQAINHYYLFGWSGELSCKARKKASKKLATQLTKLTREHAKKYASPLKIDLICHSHGGNVALYLADIINGSKRTFTINAVVLLGTPIQPETSFCMQHSLFKKIYNIYSTHDWLQTLDCFSSTQFPAKRTFRAANKNSNAPLPKTVYDINLLIDNYRPGHAEFWLTDAIPFPFYRSKFPLAPNPVVTIIPWIVDHIERMPNPAAHMHITYARKTNRCYVT